MKPKKLLVILLIVFSGCKPSSTSVLEHLQEPGYIYFYNAQSIQDELYVFKGALDSVASKADSGLYHLILDQISRTEEFQDSLMFYLKDTCSMHEMHLKAEKADTLKCAADSLKNYISKLKFSALPPQCRKPIPCPGDTSYIAAGKSMAFFSRSPHGKVKIIKNGILIQELDEGSYDASIKIRTIPIPENLQIQKGDSIVVEIPVEFLDNDKKLQNIVIKYKEKTTH